MTRTFIQTEEFLKNWKHLGLDDDDLRNLEWMIMCDPQIGPVMRGTKGLRKMRFPFRGRGKSGSIRVCYIDFPSYHRVYLINAFAKSDKDNLSAEERNQIRMLVQVLESELERKGKDE